MFSPGRFADRIFNADDRAAELNRGSYSAIPIELRRQVNVEFEAFVRDSIAQRRLSRWRRLCAVESRSSRRVPPDCPDSR